MKPRSTHPANLRIKRRAFECAGARILLLLLVGAVLVVAAWVLWLPRTASPRLGTAAGATPTLTESTKAVLRRLDSPLEIRFYSILDPATIPNGVTAFSARVNQLLAAYQQ